MQEKEWKTDDAPLVPVTSNHFVVSTVESNCTLKDFLDKKSLETNKMNVFLEYSSVDKSNLEKSGIRDVILMDKVAK